MKIKRSAASLALAIHNYIKNLLGSTAADERRPTSRFAIETLEDRRLMSFSPAIVYPTGANPLAVVTADFNGDGHSDLAVPDTANDQVSVFLANADGTFQPALNADTGLGPWSLKTGDFNADGKADLVTLNYSGDNISVLLGNGNGTFKTPINTNLDANAASIAVGDFNADGKLDLVAVSNTYNPGYWWLDTYFYPFYEGSASVLLGNGAGSFAAPIGTDLGQGEQSAAAVADFNNDGKLDLATSNDGNIGVMLGTGTGALGARIYANSWNAQSIAAGDVNGDGKTDLVGASTDGVIVLMGDGQGVLSNQTFYMLGDTVTGVALADYNGDGKPDVVAASYSYDGSGSVNVLLNNGVGAFRPPAIVPSGAGDVAIGDFNGDGRTDVATAGVGLSVLLNDGVWPALNAPSISVNDVTVTEGNIGTVNATFTVQLSAASSQTITVQYATADDSATVAGGDYQAVSGTLTFAPGVTSQTVTVQVNGDRLVENTELFNLRLSNETNGFIADASGLGTILDDEPRVSIDSVYGPVSVIEGNTGTTQAVFTVRLATVYDVPVSVNYSTAEGDTDFANLDPNYYPPPPAATAGSDFQAASGTLTFAPGETVKTIPIVVYGDLLAEPDEFFSVNLSAPTIGTLPGAHAVGVIEDDEPRASIIGATVKEGNTGTTAMNFTVTLSTPPAAPVTVSFATADGSATVAGGDYQAQTGTLTFDVGQTSKIITVLVNGDRIVESAEDLSVQLTGSSAGAAVDSASAYGTIADDEPRINVNSVSITEGNSGTKLMTFTVTLSAAYDQSVTVHYATSDGTATAGEDYIATSGTLTFAPGQTSKTFTVTIKGDTKKEADETFFINLSNASSNALIENYSGVGTILNDDGGGNSGHGH